MRIFEGQALGALTLLMISIIFYGISLYGARQSIRETPIPWGSQGLGLMAVEITGDPGKEGIYFLPEETTIAELRKLGVVPGMDNAGKLESARIYAGSVIDISGEGGVKTGKMAAARKLALDLPIDLNQASEGDLSLIPGIGEKIACRIIQLREKKGAFRHLSELMVIPGIKEKKINGLKKHLIAGEGCLN